MASHRVQITARTSSRIQVLNITSEIQACLDGSAVKDGLLCASVRHSTCALSLNEDESGLRKDLERVAGTLLDPVRAAGTFLHDEIDNNAQSHLTACVLGSSATVPVESGRMILGTWQSFLLLELDGPRSRKIDITVVG